MHSRKRIFRSVSEKVLYFRWRNYEQVVHHLELDCTALHEIE